MKTIAGLLICLAIFQLIALLIWYFFDFNIFLPMVAGAAVCYFTGRASAKMTGKQND